jgi:ABC-2 type transport system ATP-binding protein
MAAKIEAKDVHKRFGSHTALASFSLEIAPGCVFGIIGPNGAGKTTFLRILTGYFLPTSGDVFVDGVSVVSRPHEVKARIGYACEQPKLYLDHRVDAFLALIAALRGLSRAEAAVAIERAVERFALRDVIRRRIGVLSKGFRQRVSLAQALLHDPPLVVIDEPTVGLDPRQQIELRRIVVSLGGSHTVLLCTHQLAEAEACCDRVGLLDRGRLVRVATADEIRGGTSLEELFLEVTRGRDAEAR